MLWKLILRSHLLVSLEQSHLEPGRMAVILCAIAGTAKTPLSNVQTRHLHLQGFLARIKRSKSNDGETLLRLLSESMKLF